MQIIVIAVILLSCVLHASWNLLSRGDPHQTLPFFLRMNLVSVVIGAVPAVWAQLRYGLLDGPAWAYCALSGLCLGLYFVFLGNAYRVADLSSVYPVARALPVLLVAAGDLVRGRPPSLWGAAGMLLVVTGCLLAPLTSLRELRWSSYWRRATLWMVLTALATTGYTLSDKLAQEAGAARGGGLLFVVVYGYFFFLFGTAVLWAALRWGLAPRPSGGKAPGWGKPALASVGNVGSYVLILWVYTQVAEAAYVVAFRQFSIVVGVVLAIWIFRERGARVRVPAALLITAGLVLIGVAG